jgi:hypothetical protein
MINSDKQKEKKIEIFLGQSYFTHNKQIVFNHEFLLN